MGTDNLHHKRKARAIATRAKPTREANNIVLIVCEGTKTEPNYFLELREYLRLPNGSVVIDSNCGTDPISVVNHGINLYNEHKRLRGIAYDRIYCVFDRDQYHLPEGGDPYSAAISIIAKKKTAKDIFFAINSVPCFEFWLLLHHTETTKPYNDIPSSFSAGDLVVEDLKNYWPEYSKDGSGWFDLALKVDNDDMVTAVNRARRVLSAAQVVGDENPSTKIHELIDYLKGMRDGAVKNQ